MNLNLNLNPNPNLNLNTKTNPLLQWMIYLPLVCIHFCDLTHIQGGRSIKSKQDMINAQKEKRASLPNKLRLGKADSPFFSPEKTSRENAPKLTQSTLDNVRNMDNIFLPEQACIKTLDATLDGGHLFSDANSSKKRKEAPGPAFPVGSPSGKVCQLHSPTYIVKEGKGGSINIAPCFLCVTWKKWPRPFSP